jgi:hypothetical protein
MVKIALLYVEEFLSYRKPIFTETDGRLDSDHSITGMTKRCVSRKI